MTKSPGHELAGVVDEEATVGVAVVGDPEAGSLRSGLLDDEGAVLREQRIRLVVRERAVGLEVALDHVELREPRQHRRKHRPRHPVRRVDDDPQRPERPFVDEREDLCDEPVPDVGRRHLAALRDLEERALRVSPDVLEPRVAADGKRTGAHDLHPGVLLRVVRRGDAYAAVEAELADRVVDHLGADQPEVEDVGASVGRSLDQRRRHRRRREPHVAPHGDPGRPEVLDVAPSDPVGAVLVELRRVDPADVVGLEDGRGEHAPDARGSPEPADAPGRLAPRVW